MDCIGLSPFSIDALNFGLTFVAFFPAFLVGLFTWHHWDRQVADRYPSERNRNRRTALSARNGSAAILVFFVIWGIGLSVLEGFRCAFL